MLNAVLTVRAHQANSHRDKGWEKFTDATVSYLNKNRSGLVFILWGSYAQKKGSQIDKVSLNGLVILSLYGLMEVGLYKQLSKRRKCWCLDLYLFTPM